MKAQQAYEIGYNAAKNDGYCIFSQNVEAQQLIVGLPVGSGEGVNIMKSFVDGVRKASDEICEVLLNG